MDFFYKANLTTIFINRYANFILMGRIKTTLIKRSTKELLETYGENFTPDFSENKVLLANFMEVRSKRLRNIIAGYMTRLKKRAQ